MSRADPAVQLLLHSLPPVGVRLNFDPIPYLCHSAMMRCESERLLARTIVESGTVRLSSPKRDSNLGDDALGENRSPVRVHCDRYKLMVHADRRMRRREVGWDDKKIREIRTRGDYSVEAIGGRLQGWCD